MLPLIHGRKVNFHQTSQWLCLAGQFIAERHDVVGGLVPDLNRPLRADGFAVVGAKRVAFVDSELLAAAVQELGFREVPLRVERVFPDVAGVRRAGDVDAVEEELDQPGRWQGLERAFGA